VHTIILKERLNRPFDYPKKKECLNAFLKVNMTNPMPLVAVATVCYVNYINLSIYICTQSLLKSLDEKALHLSLYRKSMLNVYII
jgi:hypothetical protein